MPYLPQKIFIGAQAMITHHPDMEKDNFLTQARFVPKLFYPKKCVNFDKIEFATKQRKMYLTTSMSKQDCHTSIEVKLM